MYGALAAVKSPLGDGPDVSVRCFLDYGVFDVEIWRNGKKFYCTFNYSQLVKFPFKFGLRITH